MFVFVSVCYKLMRLYSGNPWWTSILAVVPALLACILLFMDQQITAVIVNRKEHKLKVRLAVLKCLGSIIIIFIIIFILYSILGIPYTGWVY